VCVREHCAGPAPDPREQGRRERYRTATDERSIANG
ncbi:hypothetical protein BN1708_019480, partial [Verticillium longisporum]